MTTVLQVSLVLVLVSLGSCSVPDHQGIRSPLPRLSVTDVQDDCPCSNPSYCEPISGRRDFEVFGFAGGTGGDWETFDWSTVTTVAWGSDPQLMCHAHAHGARIISAPPAGMPLTGDSSVRAKWIAGAIAATKAHHLDGITFDYESPMDWNSSQVDWYSTLVRETTEAYHKAIPGSQVSVCVAWAPDDIDGRAYDYVALAEGSDYLYQMVYDTRSQIFGRCVASANAGLSTVQRGVQRYLDLGIAPSKLILGLPWYGYDYPCEKPMTVEDDFCSLKLVPFRGVNCSDAAGREVSYCNVRAVLDAGASLTSVNQTSGRRWDESLQTPYFNYVAEDGTVHQVWYDDPESLALKYDVAVTAGLGGTGPFTFTYLDKYGNKTNNTLAPAETKEMWEAIKAAKQQGERQRLRQSGDL